MIHSPLVKKSVIFYSSLLLQKSHFKSLLKPINLFFQLNVKDEKKI